MEEEKPAVERGYYLYPEEYGQPKDKGIQYAHRSQAAPPLESERKPASPAEGGGHSPTDSSLFDAPAGYTQVQPNPDEMLGGKKK